MSELIHEVNSSLNEAQIREKQAFDEQNGPLQLIQRSVRSHSKVLISLRNNHKLLARVKAFDRHLNMVLENVKEMWTEYPSAKGKKPVDKDKFISKMFLRGDNVVVVLSTMSFGEGH